MQSELSPPPVPIIKKPEDDFSELDNQKPEKAVSEQLESLSPPQEDAPQYFTRSKRKRSISSEDDNKEIYKIIRAMIAVYAPDYAHSSTEESVFPTTEVSNIKIPKSYLDAMRDSLYPQQ
jgi:hypothetical protein